MTSDHYVLVFPDGDCTIGDWNGFPTEEAAAEARDELTLVVDPGYATLQIEDCDGRCYGYAGIEPGFGRDCYSD